jgi:hypothetical protein
VERRTTAATAGDVARERLSPERRIVRRLPAIWSRDYNRGFLPVSSSRPILGGRSTVGHHALDVVIGVRIPASQPTPFKALADRQVFQASSDSLRSSLSARIPAQTPTRSLTLRSSSNPCLPAICVRVSPVSISPHLLLIFATVDSEQVESSLVSQSVAALDDSKAPRCMLGTFGVTSTYFCEAATGSPMNAPKIGMSIDELEAKR